MPNVLFITKNFSSYLKRMSCGDELYSRGVTRCENEQMMLEAIFSNDKSMKVSFFYPENMPSKFIFLELVRVLVSALCYRFGDNHRLSLTNLTEEQVLDTVAKLRRVGMPIHVSFVDVDCYNDIHLNADHTDTLRRCMFMSNNVREFHNLPDDLPFEQYRHVYIIHDRIAIVTCDDPRELP